MLGSPCQSVLASCQVTDQSEIRSHSSLTNHVPGLGAYPECSDPRPGQGPSRPEMLTTEDQSQLEKINFETVEKIKIIGLSSICINFII